MSTEFNVENQAANGNRVMFTELTSITFFNDFNQPLIEMTVFSPTGDIIETRKSGLFTFLHGHINTHGIPVPPMAKCTKFLPHKKAKGRL